MTLSKDQFNTILRDRIKLLRIEKEMTQDELTEKAGLSVNYIRNYESNPTSLNAFYLVAIMRALDVSPNELLSDFDLSEAEDGFLSQFMQLGDNDRQYLIKNMKLHQEYSKRNY